MFTSHWLRLLPMPFRPAGCLVAVCLVLTAIAAAQDPPRQTFRVGAEMVVVDLVATTPAGDFVGARQPAGIHPAEAGPPRKVEFLRLVRSGGPAAVSASPEVAGLPASAASKT